MERAYITSCGAFLPGEPVDNEQIESRLGVVGGSPSKLRGRMLAANGIETRHYALDRCGRTTMLNEELAANAVSAALHRRGLTMDDVDLLAAGTTQGDLPVPGFASMVHGRLGGGPVETLSVGGVCGSGFGALRVATATIRLGDHRVAVAVGSEQVSRILKASRFDPAGRRAVDAEFLRWMLSDGAGAVVVEPTPRPDGVSLRVDWTHSVSHAHEHDVCMFAGAGASDRIVAGATWLDRPHLADAEAAGTMHLRQDVRRLPALVALGVNEYVRLLEAGRIDPAGVDHVLCHYSSAIFRSRIFNLMTALGVMIDEDRWFSNLATKGNTGAASIFIMVEEALEQGRFAPGDRILLMVPESGRFSVSFAHLTAVASPAPAPDRNPSPPPRPARPARPAPTVRADHPARPGAPTGPALPASQASPAEPTDPSLPPSAVDTARLLARLADVWADFERRLADVPIVARIEAGRATPADYGNLLLNLRQQVADGARWITRAASNIGHDKIDLRARLVRHAATEQLDFQMLERDYVNVGGRLADIQGATKNIGSAALSAFLFHRADQPDPLDLLGAMFVIEGLGARRALGWAGLLADQLDLRPDQLTFLRHHGVADADHTAELRAVLGSGWITPEVADAIVATARTVARLYALQLEELDDRGEPAQREGPDQLVGGRNPGGEARR